MFKTRYKEWQEQGTCMVSLHFTSTSAETPWLAMGDPTEYTASLGGGAGSQDIPPSPFSAGSRAAATQHTKPLTGPRLFQQFAMDNVHTLQLYGKSLRLIQICTLLIFPATSSELIQLESDLTSQ